MGNQAGSLKKHIETAEKTGALNFTDKGLEKFPPELFKVRITSKLINYNEVMLAGWGKFKKPGLV